MKRTEKRRRDRERTIAAWERNLRDVLAGTRRELVLQADEVLPDDLLVAEVLVLADPDTYAGLEVVIPAPRVDLAAAWFRAVLSGEAEGKAGRAQLACRLAAPPDDVRPPGFYPWGPGRVEVERAVTYLKRRRETL